MLERAEAAACPLCEQPLTSEHRDRMSADLAAEHAALAAAMCRAAGVPAQVVTGLAYVKSFAGKQDVFVPHAWFRVFIDGKWVDYDAALKTFDAGHIALVAGDGNPSDFFAVVNTLGNFRIAEATKN